MTPGEVGAWEGPEQRAGGMSWAPAGCSGARQEQGWLLLWSRRCERRGEIPAPGWLLKEAWMGLADVGCERMQVSRLVWSPDRSSERLGDKLNASVHEKRVKRMIHCVETMGNLSQAPRG